MALPGPRWADLCRIDGVWPPEGLRQLAHRLRRKVQMTATGGEGTLGAKVIWEFLLIGYVICVGFVAAGILASLYQMATSNAPQFRLSHGGLIAGLFDVLMIAFAGPLILLKNAIRGRLIEDRPFGWLVASSALSGFWSFCSGTLFLSFLAAG